MTAALAFLPYALAGLGGLMIGSFLTVLVCRVPPLVLAERSFVVTARDAVCAVSWPGSHCSSCDKPVRWHDNIPLVSYVALRGTCRSCGSSYGAGYVLLEVLAGLGAILAVTAFGWSAYAGWVFLLLAVLLALSAIDLAEQLLPDILVLPLLPLGLLFSMQHGVGLTSAISGSFVALLILGGIGMAWRWKTGEDGMGWGDVKLAAALGAWLGAESTLFFLVTAFFLGVLSHLPRLVSGRLAAGTPVAFGPFLCASGALFALVPGLTPTLELLLAGG